MTDLKDTAKLVFLETLKSIDPETVIKDRLRVAEGTLRFDEEQVALDDFKEVVLIGMGKASLRMGFAVESLLGERVKRGLLVTDRFLDLPVRCEVVLGGHPLPDSNSILAGQKIISLIESCSEQSLLIFLISGGGSALVELPVSAAISLEDLRLTNRALITCGAAIHEINRVRKALSRIKGGGLGRLARRSKSIGLYISDVNPGDILAIASNPLLVEKPEEETPWEIIARYNLTDSLPCSVMDVLQRQPDVDTVAEWSRNQSEPIQILLLDNQQALQQAAEHARRLGFNVEVRSDLIEGEYQTVAERLIEQLVNLKSSFPNERVCVISGGEVLCPVRGDGIGGRNQEFVLYSAARLGELGISGATVLSCGTDGIDGNSDAAGAVADAELIINAAQHGIDASTFLSRNDSNTFFRRAGGLVVTGPSGNNVRDLRILMSL